MPNHKPTTSFIQQTLMKDNDAMTDRRLPPSYIRALVLLALLLDLAGGFGGIRFSFKIDISIEPIPPPVIHRSLPDDDDRAL
jgi:hypothetical protein